jgi:hypothetical protein
MVRTFSTAAAPGGNRLSRQSYAMRWAQVPYNGCFVGGIGA